jgi:outer membrane protein OmpA-like peptidoglycan-associated protein
MKRLFILLLIISSIKVFGQINCRRENLPDIMFKHNSFELLDEKYIFNPNSKDSMPPDKVVDRYYNYLVKNPSFIIQLCGLASTNETNPKALSLKRADAFAKKLFEKGISQTRISTVGYGVTRLNISADSIGKAKTKTDRDLLHQLNRQVIYRVISFDGK